MMLRIKARSVAGEIAYLDLQGKLVAGEQSSGKLHEALLCYIEEYRCVCVNIARLAAIDREGVSTLAEATFVGMSRGTRVEVWNAPQPKRRGPLSKLRQRTARSFDWKGAMTRVAELFESTVRRVKACPK